MKTQPTITITASQNIRINGRLFRSTMSAACHMAYVYKTTVDKALVRINNAFIRSEERIARKDTRTGVYFA